MYEILSDPKALALFLLGGYVTLLTWAGKRAIKKFDDLNDNAVRREEMLRLHSENTARLDKINDGVERTHERIDDIYRDLMNKP